jgi:hypothetical protein
MQDSRIKNLRCIHFLLSFLAFNYLAGGCFLFWITFPIQAIAETRTAAPTDARQKELEKMVRQAARHLEHTIKKEGFFSARVALNVWKSTALDAGLYDDTTYADYRHRIYTQSIKSNRAWFEGYIQDHNLQNASTCLEFWRLHSLELGTLDPAEYEELQKRLKQARKASTK